MRKKLILSVIILCIFTISIACFTIEKTPTKIGLIPLDSRPCNTQYPQILGTIGNANVTIPYELLDNYLVSADTNKLWDWLDKEAKNFNKIIINTTELFNGSLIASRNPQSYQDFESNLKRLRDFCLNNKRKEIIVITVLPRLLPSQFTDLWPYKDVLTEFAKEIDKGSLANKNFFELPSKIPENILNKYLRIYENTQQIVENIIGLTNEGLVDHYLIGQDDAEKYGLSNKIVREITPYLNDKIQFVHGADELTMLALAKFLLPMPAEGLNITYTNPELKDDYFPYEAAILENVINTKMDYLNLPLNNQSPYLGIVHTDTTKSANINLPPSSQYIGIMDIAYTNRGDIALLDWLLENNLKEVDGYAGWNTASNTIGTELAHFVFYQNLKQNFKNYNNEAKEAALKAYIKFKFIRVAEDLVYQGILRNELNKELVKKNIDPYDLREKKSEAEEILRKLYKPYKDKLEVAFLGEYSIGEIKFTVTNISAEIELPWARTFEAKIVPQVEIAKERRDGLLDILDVSMTAAKQFFRTVK